MKKWLPPVLTVIMAAWFLGTLRAPVDQDFALSEFGRLPVLFDGRLKPMDSVARNSLLQIREKQTVNLEPWKSWNQKPKIISATEWLVNVMMNPAVADQWPVFRVDNPELIALLKLPDQNESQHQDGKHYSWDQMRPAFPEFDKESERIGKIESSHRNAYERAVVKVRERLMLYARLKNTVQPPDAENWPEELAEYEKLIPAGVAAVQAQQAGQKFDETTLRSFAGFVQTFDDMGRYDAPLVIPPANSKSTHDGWERTSEALLEAIRDGKANPAVQAYAAMDGAFRADDVKGFNQALADYRASLVPNFAPDLARARHEVFFNQMQPFYAAMTIYVLAGLLAGLFWFNLSEPLRRSAVWLIVLALVIHTTGLGFRIVLQGRPPVTNLYSSAIFIGWGAVVLGLVLERFFRNGIGLVISASMGFITLIIAHHLSFEGDTMEMMRAVLDTNFWLATHVVVVTLGYASTFVAGFLGILFVGLGVFTRRLSTRFDPDKATGVGIAVGATAGGVAGAVVGAAVMRKSAQLGDDFGKSLTRMIYGIVCFATLFSFVGTVLGGIWADQSWGRFWGWDPKENGALIIVLWNALILHLRWGGIVRERGLANCAIFGNIVTSWSWFGVNMLGIGLHSYGFMDAAFVWLMLFVSSQIGLILLGCLPLNMWKSFQNRTTSTATTSKPEDGGAGKPASAAT